MSKPETQLECWAYVVNGGTLLQDDMKIKFLHGRLCAIIKSKWTPCPIIFENPSMFRYLDGFHTNHGRVV